MQARADFWNGKILGWEQSRYSRTPWSLISGRPLRHRMRMTQKILASLSEPFSVLDLGCGSGLFLQSLQNTKASSLYGVDISAAAIAEAKRRSWALHTLLDVKDCLAVDIPAGSIVTALGLLDWLTLDEIRILFKRLQNNRFVISCSEDRPVLSRWIHKMYIKMKGTSSYAHSFKPQYHSSKQIKLLAKDISPLFIYRDRRLQFGSLLMNFAPSSQLLPGQLELLNET